MFVARSIFKVRLVLQRELAKNCHFLITVLQKSASTAELILLTRSYLQELRCQCFWSRLIFCLITDSSAYLD